MRLLVIFSPGPQWIAGQPATKQERAVIGPHLRRMRALFDEGSMIFGGPTSEGFGGMALIESRSVQEAEAMMDLDPAVAAGVMTYALTPLNPYFDAFSGRAWAPNPS